MTRECHVRFCERLGVKVPRPTYHQTGFALWVKRLETARFAWPRKVSEAVLTLSEDQLQWLLAGYDITLMKPHESLHYQRVS